MTAHHRARTLGPAAGLAAFTLIASTLTGCGVAQTIGIGGPPDIEWADADPCATLAEIDDAESKYPMWGAEFDEETERTDPEEMSDLDQPYLSAWCTIGVGDEYDDLSPTVDVIVRSATTYDRGETFEDTLALGMGTGETIDEYEERGCEVRIAQVVEQSGPEATIYCPDRNWSVYIVAHGRDSFGDGVDQFIADGSIGEYIQWLAPEFLNAL